MKTLSFADFARKHQLRVVTFRKLIRKAGFSNDRRPTVKQMEEIAQKMRRKPLGNIDALIDEVLARPENGTVSEGSNMTAERSGDENEKGG